MKKILYLILVAVLVLNLPLVAQKKKGKEVKKGGVPEWITKPGSYEDQIVAAGIGEGSSEQIAKTAAELDARKKIAQTIESQVQSLSTNFMEEASTTTGQGSTSASQEYFSEVTKSMTNVTLKNVIIEEYYPPQGEKNGKKIKFYAKAVLGKTDFAAKFKEQVSSDVAAGKIAGVKLSADQAIAALNKAIGKWDNEGATEEKTEMKTTAGAGAGAMGMDMSAMGAKKDIGATGSQTKGKGYGDWQKGLPNRPSRPGYYQGLGVVDAGKDQGGEERNAENDSRSQVIRAISSEIKSSVTSAMSESTKNGKTDYEENFNSVTESFSQETLKNLVVEFYTDKKSKKRYAYCEIAIDEVNRQFAERLKKAVNVAKTYYMSAKTSEANGDYFLAVTQYLAGAKEVVVAEAINKEPIEGDIDGSGKSVSVRATFDSQLKNILGKMRIEVVSGDAQKAVKGEPLGQPLVARLICDFSGTAVPVKNAVLVTASVDPTVVKADENAQTDGSGNASFSIHSVDNVNPSGINKIRVGLGTKEFEAFASFLPGAMEKAKLVFKDFSFSAKGSSITKIVILIFEENIGKAQSNSIIEGDLVKQLVSNKYKVMDKNEVYRAINREQARASAEANDDAVSNAIKSIADVLVIGTAKAMESVGGADNPYGGGGNRVSAWADCSIRVIDLETNKTIANSDLQREKGLSVGAAEKAGIIALQNISKKATKELLDGLNKALK